MAGSTSPVQPLYPYQDLAKKPVPGIAAGPISEKNIFEWEAFVRYATYLFFSCSYSLSGPEDTPYAKGTFRATLSFPTTYPMNPPKMKFTTPIFHPNGSPFVFLLLCLFLPQKLLVFKDGNVCISILHPPGEDPMGYEVLSHFCSLS